MPARALARSAEPYPSPGPRALALAQKAKAARPTDPEALLAYCDAFFFANSVKVTLTLNPEP